MKNTSTLDEIRELMIKYNCTRDNPLYYCNLSMDDRHYIDGVFANDEIYNEFNAYDYVDLQKIISEFYGKIDQLSSFAELGKKLFFAYQSYKNDILPVLFDHVLEDYLFQLETNLQEYKTMTYQECLSDLI